MECGHRRLPSVVLVSDKNLSESFDPAQDERKEVWK
jgi:hypothetical protein